MLRNEAIVHVIDDEEAVRAAISFLLEVEGFTVRAYASADAFLEVLPQGVHGCISPYVLEQAAEAAGVRDSMVQAICKRYPSLKTAPYNHEIILCTGRNCASKGSLTVMDELKKRLGVGKNGISEDGTVCLKTRNCLKNCRKAPNVMVDGRLCSGLDAEGILRELKRR